MRYRLFGISESGKEIALYALQNKNGMRMHLTDLGAVLQSLYVKDRTGDYRDVVLGYDRPEFYEKRNGTFFGATVGRCANRIGKGRFQWCGIQRQLEQNDHENCLHSGSESYSYRVWSVKQLEQDSITFELDSPDGDQGYPGALHIEVTYILTDENELIIRYEAQAEEDTVLNLTNHSYFNLNGHDSGDVMCHNLWIDADYFTRVDNHMIPTGELVSVEGTPMDFRTKKRIGKDIEIAYEALEIGHGYDHNYCLKNAGSLQKVAELSSDESGISMEIYTDLPGMQLYTGNFIEKESGKQGTVYEKRQGVCFETQHYPDAVNHNNFPSPVLRKGERNKNTTIYKFNVEEV